MAPKSGFPVYTFVSWILEYHDVMCCLLTWYAKLVRWTTDWLTLTDSDGCYYLHLRNVILTAVLILSIWERKRLCTHVTLYSFYTLYRHLGVDSSTISIYFCYASSVCLVWNFSNIIDTSVRVVSKNEIKDVNLEEKTFVHVSFHIYGVVWHTGKVLASGAVGPRFKPRQGQGIL